MVELFVLGRRRVKATMGGSAAIESDCRHRQFDKAGGARQSVGCFAENSIVDLVPRYLRQNCSCYLSPSLLRQDFSFNNLI